MESRAIQPRTIWRARTALPLLLLILCSSTTISQAADDPDKPKRGDEFLLFRDTKVELPGGDSRTFNRGTRGRVIQVEGTRIVAMVERARVTVSLDDIAAGRSGVARLSAVIRDRPEDWASYIHRGYLRRAIKDYEGAIKDFRVVPEDAEEYPHALGYIGLAHCDQAKWQDAIDHFTKSIEMLRELGGRRTLAATLMHRGAAYYRLEKLDEAIDDLEEAIKLGYEEDTGAYRHLAQVLVKRNRKADAVDTLKKAKRLDPGDSKVRQALVEIYIDLRLESSAMAELEEALNENGEEIELLSTRAQLLLKQKQFDAAMQDIEIILKEEPSHPAALLCKGTILLVRNDQAALLEICRQLTDVKLSQGQQFYMRAYLMMAVQRDEEAIADIEQALALGYRKPELLFIRAKVNVQKENWEKVISDADEIVRSEPRLAEAYYLRGFGRNELGQHESALADLHRAIELKPTADAYAVRGQVHTKLEHPDEAVADLRSAVGLKPDDEDIAFAFIKLLYEYQLADEAILHLTNCIERFDHDAANYWRRGSFWQTKDEHRLAIADFTESLLLAPDQPESYIRRAHSYIELKQPDRAAADLESAARSGPFNPSGRFVLGNLHEFNGDYEKAVEQYRTLFSSEELRVHGHARLARIYATAPAEQFRDGKQAVEHARTACELSKWEAPFPIAYLAAAHAESGDFAAAVEWQTKALAMAEERDREELTKQLELYKSGKPYRQTPKVRVATMPK